MNEIGRNRVFELSQLYPDIVDLILFTCSKTGDLYYDYYVSFKSTICYSKRTSIHLIEYDKVINHCQ